MNHTRKTMLGVMVRKLREQKSWSIGELARHSGVPKSGISRLESGALRTAHERNLDALARALDVPTAWLRELGQRLAAPQPPNEGLVNTTDSVDAPHAVAMLMKRQYCHLIIDRLPSAGVEDVFDILHQVFEYYANRPQTITPPTVSKKTPARKGKTYERPPFHFDEE